MSGRHRSSVPNRSRILGATSCMRGTTSDFPKEKIFCNVFLNVLKRRRFPLKRSSTRRTRPSGFFVFVESFSAKSVIVRFSCPAERRGICLESTTERQRTDLGFSWRRTSQSRGERKHACAPVSLSRSSLGATVVNTVLCDPSWQYACRTPCGLKARRKRTNGEPYRSRTDRAAAAICARLPLSRNKPSDGFSRRQLNIRVSQRMESGSKNRTSIAWFGPLSALARVILARTKQSFRARIELIGFLGELQTGSNSSGTTDEVFATCERVCIETGPAVSKIACL